MSKQAIPVMPWAAKHFWHFRPLTFMIIFVAVSLMGTGEGLLIQAALGSTPWTVLSQGVALQTGLSIGVVTALISVLVLLLWIPFKLRIGFGTLVNVVCIALFIDITIHLVPAPESLLMRFILMAIGVIMFGISTAFYLSCHLGAGPRDGLMVGLCYSYGWRVGYVRMGIEITVALIGWLLGGNLGISTLIFAFLVGWIIQLTVTGFIHWNKKSNPVN